MKRVRVSQPHPAPSPQPASAGPVPRLVLLQAPVLSGAAIMGLELVGLRLLGPRFGASTYVWGGLLGTVMAALALGYLGGGALADRRPRPRWVFGLLLAGAAWVAADLLIAEPVLDMAERLGATRGPLVATAVLLAPSMIVLGSVSPFVVKLEGELSLLGISAGRVLALSTAGSLAGTFLTAFWWIPDYGCRHTLRILFVALVALGMAGLAWPASRGQRAALALALIGLPFLIPDPPLPAGIIFAGESPYNTVFVEDQGGKRLLRLNAPAEGYHSVRIGHGVATGDYYDVLSLGPLLAQGRRVLVLGMGGGTTVTAYRRLYPGARVTAVEIDPLVVRVAHEYMGLERGPDVEVHVEDARAFLRRGTELFDVIEADVFAGSPYSPFYCLTAEFFAAARNRLAPTGLLALNVYAPDGDRTLAGAVVGTLETVFPTVFEVPAPEASVLIAFREPTRPETVRARLDGPELPGDLAPVAGRAAAALSITARGRGIVLTDDRAPVEPLTREMIVRRDGLRATPGRN